MTTYKQIQLTNSAITDVAVDALLPLGNVTRRINSPIACCNTFSISNSNIDTVTVNDTGFYKILYSLTAVAGAAGTVSVELLINGNTLFTVSGAVADADVPVNITIPYTIRVCTCANGTSSTEVPTTIQFKNTGVALTGTSSNLIIEKV